MVATAEIRDHSSEEDAASSSATRDRAVVTQVEEGPDLVTSNPTASVHTRVGRGQLRRQNKVRVSVRLENAGTERLPTRSWLRFSITDREGNEVGGRWRRVGRLRAGRGRTYRTHVRMPRRAAAGTYTMAATADARPATGRIDEVDEENNEALIDFDYRPEQRGFTFPDEWDEHDGTVMIFPARHSYGKEAPALQREFAAVANAIQRNEQVHAFVYPDDLGRARRLLDARVKIHKGKAYSIDWARDTAPMIVRHESGRRKGVCFQFNGWGEKYEGWEDDVGVNLAIARELDLPIVKSKLVLEGGAIEIGATDEGQIGIVTEQCVLNPNRTDWPKAKVEAELKEKLGLQQIIWLPKGLNPDPVTDGHVDGLLKFIDKNTVLLHTTDDESDINYETCLEAKKTLEQAGLEVIELPLAWDVVHMNFYIGSGGGTIYVPICGDPEQDDPALRILRDLFDEVIPIMANAIAEAGGGIHCYTQQIPAGE